jgi:2'-5' RNA ligase
MIQQPNSRPPAKRTLYLMSKPPLQEQAAVACMPRYPTVRNPELLHCTILALADLAERPEESLDAFIKLMSGFRAYAFYLQFDRIVENGVVALSSRKRLQGAAEFQRQLVQFLQARGFLRFRNPPRPHVTLKYGRDEMGTEDIPPIGWKVDELLLIESLVGKSSHVPKACWQLEPLLI